MRSPPLLLLALAGCAPTVFALRTQHTALLSVESGSPSLACELPARHGYGDVQQVAEKREGAFSPVDRREAWAPLPLRLLNRTDEVVTVDWERSAFVDASGLSHRVRVFQGAAADAPDAAAKPVDRPPAAVIAPGARAEALVLPEPTPPAPAMFFLPPYAADGAPLKLVVSTTGSSTQVASCVVTARLEQTTVVRNADVKWPGHGEACIPKLGCAEGTSCRAGVCVDPKVPPLPPGYTPGPTRKRLFGESCDKDDDCVQGFRCDRRQGTCGGG